MKFSRSSTLLLLFGLFAGLGLGLLYSWRISPVTYVDAEPSILRADFKDQYRIVIAAAYVSTHDLPRARARLELLKDPDPVGELSAQAQRMMANGEPDQNVQPLAQLAADLGQGHASSALPTVTVTKVAFIGTPFTAIANTPGLETPTAEELGEPATETLAPPVISTLPFDQTPLAPQQLSTVTPRPTFTATAGIDTPFALVGQETVCDPNLEPGLLQFSLTDSRRDQVSGVQIIVTWDKGEDNFFTGFKPEVGDGYADFIMEAGTVYSIRVVDGGSFVPNISAPTCTDDNGGNYLGGLLLTFQQP
ncbi:MAG: hypothetical protein HY865_19390 [Chloroflexi bacterium]|nr:hypothetical protein [Chloroflexota bacterium]